MSNSKSIIFVISYRVHPFPILGPVDFRTQAHEGNLGSERREDRQNEELLTTWKLRQGYIPNLPSSPAFGRTIFF